MFAVPGWSVSLSALKTQTLDSLNPVPNVTTTSIEESKGKKRKRSGSGKSKARDVNATNLADLWESVIEGKKKPKSAKHSEKRQKIAMDENGDGVEKDGEERVLSSKRDAKNTHGKEKKKKREKTSKEKRREKKEKHALDESTDTKTTTESTNAAPPPPPKPTATLTPLQASMRQKLISARFRHLNQTLYTTPSTHSLELFSSNPEMFAEYHEGFRRQVEVWPENPVDSYLTQIKARGKVRGPHRKPQPSDPKTEAVEVLAPLPRTDGCCNIADLGCGDAGLAKGLQQSLKKLKVKIHSFDLQNPSSLVTKADIANLPLEGGSVDVAVFCLALMGTNWVDFIEEAFRILRWKGELWVAEIKSRFGRVGGIKNKRVEHSVGNRVKNNQPEKNKKASKKAEEDQDGQDLAIEVDGEEKRQETDVSAFVEVLRKRGFVLQGEVDLRNRMFVKMCFLKAATPVKGKGVPVPQGMAEMGLETWQKKPKGKFIDQEEVVVGSEAAVLKPCVYKLR
jgi:ribosomal RNA-processing protein 8